MTKHRARAAVALGALAIALGLATCSSGGDSAPSPYPSGITADHPWYSQAEVLRQDGAEPTIADQQEAIAALQSRLASNGPTGAYVFAADDGTDIVVAFTNEPDDAVQASLEAPLSADFRPVWAVGEAAATQLSSALPETAEADDAAALAAEWADLDCTHPGDGIGASYGEGPARALVACSRDGLNKYVLGPVEMDGTSIASAWASPVTNSLGQATGGWQFFLTFTPSGTDRFAALTIRLATSAPPENALAIVLNGFVLSAPTVVQSIEGGEVQIPTGQLDEAAVRAQARGLQQSTAGLSVQVWVTQRMAVE